MKPYFTSLFSTYLLTSTILSQKTIVSEQPRLLNFSQVFKDLDPIWNDYPETLEFLKITEGPLWNIECNRGHVYSEPAILLPLFQLDHSSHETINDVYLNEKLNHPEPGTHNILRSARHLNYNKHDKSLSKKYSMYPEYNLCQTRTIFGVHYFVIARPSEALGLCVCVLYKFSRGEELSQFPPIIKSFMQQYRKTCPSNLEKFDPTVRLNPHSMNMVFSVEDLKDACEKFSNWFGAIIYLPDLDNSDEITVTLKLIENVDKKKSKSKDAFIYTSRLYIFSENIGSREITNDKEYRFSVGKKGQPELKKSLHRGFNKPKYIIPREQDKKVTYCAKKNEICAQSTQLSINIPQESRVSDIAENNSKRNESSITTFSSVPKDKTVSLKDEITENKLAISVKKRSNSELQKSKTDKKKDMEHTTVLQASDKKTNKSESVCSQSTTKDSDVYDDTSEKSISSTMHTRKHMPGTYGIEKKNENILVNEKEKSNKTPAKPTIPGDQIVTKEQSFFLIIIVFIIGLLALIIRRFFLGIKT
ncbi:hypothetical protein CDIK_1591 [Cucumispora dikerogammari]|nr:hypothetical protein CDIK_1591 [Cucumispora dikerogammari]